MQPERKTGFVPKLRFPEFLGTTEWKFVPLNKLAKRCTQKSRSGAITRVLTNSAEYGVVDQRDYFDKDIATQGNLESYYVVGKGDYVYNPRISVAAPVGPISKNNVATGVMSPLYSVFRFGDSNNDFYAYYFKTAGWHQYMRQASSTGARHDRMAITNDDFMAMPLPASTPEEQQKIADCLTSLDDLIRLEAEKLDAIKAHKKGLMHQLFPAEGETLPKLRFPEFRNAGRWMRKTLAQIAEIKSGSTPSRANEEFFVGGTIPWVKTTDLNNSLITTTEEQITSKAKARLNPAGSVLVAMYGGFNQIGRTGCLGIPAATNQAISVLQLDQKIALPAYVLAWLNAKVEDWKRIASSSRKDPNITGADVANFPIALPKIQEQQRIADCLTSIDTLIIAVTKELETLKTHKNGLMQQLFPTMDEVME